MKKLVLLLACLSATLLAPIASAQSPQAGSPAPPDSCRFVDGTSPQVRAELDKRKTLTPMGASEVKRTSDGQTSTQISIAKFLAYGEEGDPVILEVKCTLVCSGNHCANTGCMSSSGGCGSWGCGSGCTGTCTQESVITE
jgi:hypothetical protein